MKSFRCSKKSENKETHAEEEDEDKGVKFDVKGDYIDDDDEELTVVEVEEGGGQEGVEEPGDDGEDSHEDGAALQGAACRALGRSTSSLSIPLSFSRSHQSCFQYCHLNHQYIPSDCIRHTFGVCLIGHHHS